MRFRVRIGTIMVGIAAVGLGLSAFTQWRREVPGGPPAAGRIARDLLAERTLRRSSGPSTADSATVAAFALAAIVASKSFRAIAARRAKSLREGRVPGR